MLRFEQLENRLYKMEEKVEKQSVEVAETRVYVQEIYKRLEEMKINIDSMANEHSKENINKKERTAKIIERMIWAVVTILGYFIGKGGM